MSYQGLGVSDGRLLSTTSNIDGRLLNINCGRLFSITTVNNSGSNGRLLRTTVNIGTGRFLSTINIGASSASLFKTTVNIGGSNGRLLRTTVNIVGSNSRLRRTTVNIGGSNGRLLSTVNICNSYKSQ